MPDEKWIPIEDGFPPPGIYLTQVDRGGDIIEVKKKLVASGSSMNWFGGCRPFCDNDIVIAWKRPTNDC